MAQQGTSSLHQEMFENAVAALLVALARLPSRMTKQPGKALRRDIHGAAQNDKPAKHTKH